MDAKCSKKKTNKMGRKKGSKNEPFFRVSIGTSLDGPKKQKQKNN